MLHSFKDFTMIGNELNEKLIVIGKGKRYGQIVFMLGGAGSGKGFVIQNFMENDKFKVRDVDEWKKAFLTINKMKGKYPELADLNLKNPEDVAKLHMFTKERGIKNKTLDNILNSIKSTGAARKGTLPNIIFDITGQRVSDITNVVPLLKDVGYDPKDIHLIWVLTNYNVAVKNNKSRERIVPDDILLQTHEGAAENMYYFIKKGIPREVKGSVHVVLNNRENTVFHLGSDGKTRDFKHGKVVIKDFKYFTLRKPGKTIIPDKIWNEKLYQWFKDNVPQSVMKKLKLEV